VGLFHGGPVDRADEIDLSLTTPSNEASRSVQGERMPSVVLTDGPGTYELTAREVSGGDGLILGWMASLDPVGSSLEELKEWVEAERTAHG
jgi:hypothetical protein